MTRRRVPAGVAAVTAALLLTAPVLSAQAAEDPWWYTKGGVAAANADGYTGKGIRIAVIDQQIDPDLPVFAGADLHVHPSLCGGGISSATADPAAGWHGSNVVAFLIGNGKWMDGLPGTRGSAPKARVDFYGSSDVESAEDGTVSCSNGAATGKVLGDAIDAAVAGGADIISLSTGTSTLTVPTAQAVARAIGKGVIMVGGTSDTQVQAFTGQVYPSAANGVLSVGQVDSALKLHQENGETVDDGTNDVVGPGVDLQVLGDKKTWGTVVTASGTSWATPIVASWIALTKQKYPKATNSQLLQSVIHNTGAADHPLTRSKDGYGYGVVSLNHLLKVDPTKYDDENPLIGDGGLLDKPTRAEIEAAGRAEASATPSTAPSKSADASPGEASSGPPGWVIPVVIGAIVLVVAAGVIIAVVVTRRSRGSTAG